jgi:HK97 family phage major capsid protein
MPGAIEQDEVKAAVEELNTAFNEMKKVNDARIKAIEAGRSGAEFDEKLSRIQDVLNTQEKVQREWKRQQEVSEKKRLADDLERQAKQDEQERKMEARINRHLLGLGGAGEDARSADERLARQTYDNYLRHGAERLGESEKKVLVVSNDSTGGYLAPPSFVAEIIKAEVLFSPMRALVDVRQIGSGELQQPKRTGTAAATRVGEIQTRVESTNPSWGLVKISAPEMYAEARISNANLEDSAFSLEQELQGEFGEQFGVTEGNEIINGNGVNKCLGILDAAAAGPATPISFTVSGSAATIKGASGAEADGLINLFHAVKTAYAIRGTWIMNRQSLGKVRLLKDTTGQYLWQPGLVAGMPNSILGAPYVETPDMPDESANAFPIAFGDWKRAYKLAERLDMAITRDPLTLANVGQVKFFARRRVGGQVVLGEAIRLLKCST